MLRFNRGALGCALISTAWAATAWAGPETKPQSPGAATEVAAYVGGKPISVVDLDAKALKTDMKLAQSLYDARKAALDEIIMERALAEEAASQGLTVDEFVDKQVAEKAQPVTDADIEAFYNEKKAQLRGRSLEEVSGQIRQYLEKLHQDEARRNLLDEIKKKADVRITLAPPRVEVSVAADEPAQGPAGAKVTVVEYADFQ